VEKTFSHITASTVYDWREIYGKVNERYG